MLAKPGCETIDEPVWATKTLLPVRLNNDNTMSDAAVVESVAVGHAETEAVSDSVACNAAGRPALLVMFTGM
jgi:hypothetical protein